MLLCRSNNTNPAITGICAATATTFGVYEIKPAISHSLLPCSYNGCALFCRSITNLLRPCLDLFRFSFVHLPVERPCKSETRFVARDRCNSRAKSLAFPSVSSAPFLPGESTSIQKYNLQPIFMPVCRTELDDKSPIIHMLLLLMSARASA